VRDGLGRNSTFRNRRPRSQVRKKINQTMPSTMAAKATLTVKTMKTLGPGSACRASVAVSTILLSFRVAIRTLLHKPRSPNQPPLMASVPDVTLCFARPDRDRAMRNIRSDTDRGNLYALLRF
jgi:hypothetical protein